MARNPLAPGRTGRAKAAKKGQAGYDNPRENIDPHVKTQVLSTNQGVFDNILFTTTGLGSTAIEFGDGQKIATGFTDNRFRFTGGDIDINRGDLMIDDGYGIDCFDNSQDTTVYIQNSNATYVANVQIEGRIINPLSPVRIQEGIKLAYELAETNYVLFTVESDGDLTLSSNKASYVVDFGDGVLTTTGSITGVNVTSGADPGHTHTSASAGLWESEDATTIKPKSDKNILIETTTDASPEILLTSNNNTRGIKIELDKDGGNDDLEIIGQTTGKNTELCIKALDGENASLRLYSGNNFANLYYNSDDELIIKNTTQDKDIKIQFDDGGVDKELLIDASANTIDLGDTLLTTTGICTLGDSSQMATSAAPTADADIANKKYVSVIMLEEEEQSDNYVEED
jgi:hypothetical protein